ncbi:MAG: DUF1735 domain-containing protein [Candidatus Cryptobacteroides sp.]|nr:DUF1735 domain-containing protein [Candidatus Cryptobacteroides sp.]
MKFKLFRTALLLAAFCAASCNDSSYNLFPPEYETVLSIKDAGIKDCKYGSSITQVTDSLLILKGGGNPEVEASGRFRILSPDEACEAFGYVSTEEFVSISGDMFSLPDIIRIPEGESHLYVKFTIYPDKIFNLTEANPDKDVILPLALESETSTISESGDKMLFKFQISNPSIRWADDKDEFVEIVFSETSLELKAVIDYASANTSDSRCVVGAADEALVNIYNEANGTDYAVLPASSYELAAFDIPALAEKSSSTLRLTRQGIESDKVYLLPLKFSKEGSSIGVSEVVKYIIVTGPKYSYKDVEKTNWKVVFSNCDQRWEFPNHTGKVICDSDDMSTWISLWDGAVVGSGEDDYDYENSSSNNCHMFWKRRDIPDMVIVVELGEPVVAGKIGITKANYDFPWNHDLKDCEFYMGKSFEFKPMQEGGSWRNYQTCNDGNKWNLVLTATDVPKEIGTFWYEVPEGTSISARTGKYIKIRPTAGWRDANVCQLSELYVKALVAIDGQPVEPDLSDPEPEDPSPKSEFDPDNNTEILGEEGYIEI